MNICVITCDFGICPCGIFVRGILYYIRIFLHLLSPFIYFKCIVFQHPLSSFLILCRKPICLGYLPTRPCRTVQINQSEPWHQRQCTNNDELRPRKEEPTMKSLVMYLYSLSKIICGIYTRQQIDSFKVR